MAPGCDVGKETLGQSQSRVRAASDSYADRIRGYTGYFRVVFAMRSRSNGATVVRPAAMCCDALSERRHRIPWLKPSGPRTKAIFAAIAMPEISGDGTRATIPYVCPE